MEIVKEKPVEVQPVKSEDLRSLYVSALEIENMRLTLMSQNAELEKRVQLHNEHSARLFADVALEEWNVDLRNGSMTQKES
jgi:hypothetical protein